MRDPVRSQRGFALLDLLIGCALIATLAMALTASFGLHPERTHDSALVLESALSEARSLAQANANTIDMSYPSGSTVVVQPDPTLAGYSQIRVFRSRPIILNGTSPYPPIPDIGYPTQRFAGTVSFAAGATSPLAEPFAILLSGAGYANVQRLSKPWNDAQPEIFSVPNPCPAGAASFAVTLDGATESHAFDCNGGRFAAN